MYVHLSDAAVVPGAPLAGRVRAGREHPGSGARRADPASGAATPTPRSPSTRCIDLNEHIDVEAYEIRGRLREQTILTHPTCVFPWCTRPARALEPDEHDADCDHRVPYAKVQTQLLLQRRPAVPPASPGQDPRRLDLHRPRTRDLRVDQPARLPVPPRPPRHPRRLPRPAPPPAGPLHPARRTTDSTAPHPAGPPPAGTSARPGHPTPLVSTSSTNERSAEAHPRTEPMPTSDPSAIIWSRQARPMNRTDPDPQREQDASIRVDVPAPGAGGSTRTRPSARRQAPLGSTDAGYRSDRPWSRPTRPAKSPAITGSRHARPTTRAEADADRRAPFRF